MEIRVFADERGFEELRADWNPLLAQSRSDTVFLTWEWQTTWWRCLGNGDLWLLACYDAGKIVGIAPLYRQEQPDGSSLLGIVGCVEVSDYLDLIVAKGYEEAVYRELLRWLTSPNAPRWDKLVLCNLPQESPTHHLIPELAAACGLMSLTEVEDVCPVIALPDDFETYLQENLSKKQRHEVRRKIRRIQEEATTHWYAVDGASDLKVETDAFIRLHRLSTQEKHSFMTPEMQSFFEQITEITHEAGWLYLAFIEVNGSKAAAMLGFHYHDRLFIYNSGYDPANYADLSPGIVLTSFIIEDAIRRGVRFFDFLQGNEVYKYRFGAFDTVVYSTQLWRA
jgi:CelD/BcsL family acetyltransferase involved in cellulose biosynthesis